MYLFIFTMLFIVPYLSIASIHLCYSLIIGGSDVSVALNPSVWADEWRLVLALAYLFSFVWVSQYFYFPNCNNKSNKGDKL